MFTSGNITILQTISCACLCNACWDIVITEWCHCTACIYNNYYCCVCINIILNTFWVHVFIIRTSFIIFALLISHPITTWLLTYTYASKYAGIMRFWITPSLFFYEQDKNINFHNVTNALATVYNTVGFWPFRK